MAEMRHTQEGPLWVPLQQVQHTRLVLLVH
jgi:hypothetical protein